MIESEMPVPTLDINNVSFIVNTQLCGPGKLECNATYTDGSTATVKIERLAKYIYRVKVLAEKEGRVRLNIKQTQSTITFLP